MRGPVFEERLRPRQKRIGRHAESRDVSGSESDVLLQKLDLVADTLDHDRTPSGARDAVIGDERVFGRLVRDVITNFPQASAALGEFAFDLDSFG
jgi:hypothetical protein